LPGGIDVEQMGRATGGVGLLGAFWRLGRKFNIEVDFRLSAGEVELFGQDVQAGGALLYILAFGLLRSCPEHSR
jgi:hypothetical protein